MDKKKLLIAILTVFAILFLDQFLKIWIKTHIPISAASDSPSPFEFKIEMLENYGMAWGFAIGGFYGKVILTILRAVASVVIAVYIIMQIRKRSRLALIVILSLILAGALGNIIDSMFYGMIFSKSTLLQPAVLFPPGGGYSTFMHGSVVDFISVRVFNFQWPVFNIADSAITIGVLVLVLFQKKLYKKHEEPEVQGSSIDQHGEQQV